MAINKKTVGGFFAAALILLIFFSNTIYTYNLPVVTATKPSNGKLSKLEVSTGVADYANTENVYAVLAGIADEVLVKEGDYVEAGRELLRLSFDRDEAQRKLLEIENSRNKLLNDIKSVNLKLERVDRYAEDLSDEVYEEEKVSNYELESLNIRIETELAKYRDLRSMYTSDTLEAEVARNELQGLFLQQENLEKSIKEQTEKNKEAVKEREKARRLKLSDYEVDKEALLIDLEQKNIDLSGLELQEQPFKKALNDFSKNAAITAPCDGWVVTLDVSRGEAVRDNGLVAVIGGAGGFVVTCNVPLDNNFIMQGDECELSNTSHIIKGTVTKVTPGQNGKSVTVAVGSEEVTAGETFDLTFKKESTVSYTLVPNGAVNQDNDGYFVNGVKRRDGILGKEFYLERVNVYIGDSDSKNTVITQGIRFFEPIALISDKPAASGDTITLKNAGDFFED